MLQNAYLLSKIGADPAENEFTFAENLPRIGNYPTGPAISLAAVPPRHPGAERRPGAPAGPTVGVRGIGLAKLSNFAKFLQN